MIPAHFKEILKSNTLTKRQYEVIQLMRAHFTTNDEPYPVPSYLRVITRNLAKKTICQYDPDDHTAIFIGDNWQKFVTDHDLKKRR